jgi:hypothetical protein
MQGWRWWGIEMAGGEGAGDGGGLRCLGRAEDGERG